MLFVNLLLAFVPSLTVWLVGSQLLASFVYRTESKNPRLGRSWYAVETGLVFAMFAGSVAMWIGLTLLLQAVNK